MIVDGDFREASAPVAEFLLDLGGERKLRVHSGALQLPTRQRVQRHRLVERSDPSGAAVAGRSTISERRINDRREVIGGLGKDFDRNFGARVESDVSPFAVKLVSLASACAPPSA